VIPKFGVMLIGCIFGSIAGIFPSNLMLFYGFTYETFVMSIPFIAIGIVGMVICFYFAQKMENVS
jgi:mannose/fructose/N-acetylgalactosamine-specific phosphotransferase system component IIC